ncbi:MAG: protoglobin domain-containing protein [Pseudobdellovibrionaceae bacterium]
MQYSGTVSEPEGHKKNKGIPGYTYGSPELPQSPLSLEDLELLKHTVLWTEEDTKYLRMSREILEAQTDDILDVWFNFIKAYPHLSIYFSYSTEEHKLNKEYMEDVRLRFKQWILDTAEANYDQQWLNYQYEIALRHHRTKKNKTDAASSVEIIHFRYIPAFIYPITATLKPFLSRTHNYEMEDLECMHAAWVKSVILQVCLWSQPYVKEGDY